MSRDGQGADRCGAKLNPFKAPDANLLKEIVINCQKGFWQERRLFQSRSRLTEEIHLMRRRILAILEQKWGF